MAESCGICIEDFNRTSHKIIPCNSCDYKACKSCVEHYISDNITTTHCMSCRGEWNRAHVTKVFTKSYCDTAYKKHRENVLLDRERGLLPATQPAAERYMQVKNITKEIAKAEEEKQKIRMRIRPALPEGVLADSHDARLFNLRSRYDIRAEIVIKENEIAYLTEKRTIISGITSANAPVERREFIKACPANDCRGFLSSAWKCGLCEMWACPDCHEIKGADRDVDHTCNPDVLATVKMLADDTRQCPKCPAMIFKIEGCFAKDTPVLTWDGTLKMSQDIQIGDILIGDDGQPRVVQHLLSGVDNMYEVSQKNGMTYTVNSKHKLALKFSGDIIPKDLDIFNTSENVLEISVDDYNKLSSQYKQNLLGFKKDNTQTSITVTPVATDNYYGWSVDQNKRFLLSDFTVVRNCDQMYCTQCHTAFSWRTGRVETGTIHNPHYYEYMRQRNGGVAPRNPGDVPCGGLIRDRTMTAALNKARIDENHEIYMSLVDYHRIYNHIQHVELPKYVIRRIAENEDLRIKFLVNEINEAAFKLELQKREKAVEKKQEIHQILTMYQTVVMDLINRTTGLVSLEQFEGLNNELDEIRKYLNTQFISVSKLYNCVVPNIIFEDIKVYRNRNRYNYTNNGTNGEPEFTMKRTLMYKTQKY